MVVIIERLKSFVKNEYAFSFLAKVLGIIIAMIYSILYNRYLGAILKGDAAIVSNYISVISSFTCLGMYQAYPYYRRKEKDIFYPFLNNITTFNLLLLVVAILLAISLRVDFNLKLAVLLVPGHSFIRHINYMVLVECPTRRNMSSILISIFDLIVITGFFIFTKATYLMLTYILIIQTSINLTVSYLNLKVVLKKLKFSISEIPKYMRFGFLPMITLFLMTVNYRIDVLMLQSANNVDKSTIGIYSIGVMLAEKVWLLPDAMKDILLSRLCKGSGEEEVSKVIRISLSFSVLLVIAVALLGKPFIYLLYGKEFEGAYVITVIMLVGVIGMVFYKMIYAYNVAQGRRTVNLIFLALAALINVIGNYIFIPIYGAVGAALVSVVSYTMCGLAFLIYFHKDTRISLGDLFFLKRQDLKILTRKKT